MTLLSTLLGLFPALIIALTIAAFLYLLSHPSLLGIMTVLGCLYGLPLLAYRLHQWYYPVQSGVSYLQGKNYNPWWGSHQLQVIYIAFPILETMLRLIPGAFSQWLRLWGAQVGRDVYWTPGLEIADRGLLEIGDRVVFGHRVGLYAHIIKPRRNNLMLYVKPIKVGSDVFIGAGSRLSAGVVIPDGTYLPAITDVHPNRTVTQEES
jgi:acetyltransferase-like isoleucine patch superfamily enzyme